MESVGLQNWTSFNFLMTTTLNEEDAHTLGLWEVSEASFSPFVLIKVHWWHNELGSHVKPHQGHCVTEHHSYINADIDHAPEKNGDFF